MDTGPKNDEHRHGKAYFFSQLRNFEHIGQGRQHLDHLDFSTGCFYLGNCSLGKTICPYSQSLVQLTITKNSQTIINLFDQARFDQ